MSRLVRYNCDMTHDEYVAYHKAYREAHREELARKQRAYYRKNKEACLAYSKKWAKENPDKVKANWTKHQSTQEYRDYQQEYRKNNAQKLYQQKQAREIERYGHAHKAIRNRLSRGKLEKQPCEVCGSEPAEAHHDDYNKPLEIRWLCKKCHTKWHSENKPKFYEPVERGAR